MIFFRSHYVHFYLQQNMSTFVGTNFRRDVALNEPVIDQAEFPVFTSTAGAPTDLITFTDNNFNDLVSVEIESITLRGQSVDAHKFIISTKGSESDVLGSYLVKAKINGETVNFSCSVPVQASANTEAPISYKAGKQIISLPASSTGVVSFDGGTKVCNARFSAVGNVYVQFDDVGKPDASWNGKYAFGSSKVTVVLNNVTDPTLSAFSLSITQGDSAGEVKTIKSLVIDSVKIACDSHTAATKTAAGEIRTQSVVLGIKQIVGTLGDDSEFELSNVSLTVGNSTAVALALKFLDSISGLEAVQLSSTSSNVSLAGGASITVGTVEFLSPTLVFSGTNSAPIYGKFVQTEVSASTAGDFTAFPSYASIAAGAVGSGSVSVPLFFVPNEFSFDEHLRFRDASKADVVTIAAGWTYYDKLVEPFGASVLNVNKDAGFIIPVAEDGTISSKYVRISDLYQKLLSAKNDDIADLADRLHALEVAARYTTSDVLENEDEPEAIRLLNIKDKYSVLDISDLM